MFPLRRPPPDYLLGVCCQARIPKYDAQLCRQRAGCRFLMFIMAKAQETPFDQRVNLAKFRLQSHEPAHIVHHQVEYAAAPILPIGTLAA
jgi:hypothetical protein